MSRGNLGMFIDIPSVIIVVAITLGGVLMCYPAGRVVDAFTATLKGPGSADAAQRRQRVGVIALGQQVSWGAGVFGTFSGLIAMLADLSSPSSIGAGMAVALLTLFYAAILAEFVFNPLRQVLMNQLDAGGPDEVDSAAVPSMTSGGGMLRGAAAVLLMVTAFLTLTISFTDIQQTQASEDVVDAIKESFEPDTPSSTSSSHE